MSLKALKIFSLPYQFDDLYKEYPVGKVPLPMPESFMNANMGTKVEEINSSSFRSDEFRTEHSGLHVVFTGCSTTWGTGLLLEETWARKVFHKINEKNQCSGFFNLAFPGSSIASQVTNLFKYFKTYGNPDVVFYNVTEFRRFYSNELLPNGKPDLKVIGDAYYKPDSHEILKLLAYQYYFMLEQYCNTNNIKLYSLSWNPEHYFQQLNLFKTFKNYTEKEMLDFVIDYKINNPNIKNVEFARDNSHHGIGYNQFWADFIFNEFDKENDNFRN